MKDAIKTRMRRAPVEQLTYEMATAVYPERMLTDADMGQGWLALRREMLRKRWAEARGLKPSEVFVVVNPRLKKAYFQWKHASYCLPQLTLPTAINSSQQTFPQTRITP